MRTTLTLDEDVAATLGRLCKTREQSFKDLVNEALRRGLKQMDARPKRREPFRTNKRLEYILLITICSKLLRLFYQKDTPIDPAKPLASESRSSSISACTIEIGWPLS
jgi:hypothetical protein